MKYFKERFGQEKISLNSKQEFELKQKLSEIDSKRIEFFALVSLIVGGIFILLDFTSMYKDLGIYYLSLDLLLFISSLLSLIALSNASINKLPFILRKIIISAYPIITIAWATGIATLNPESTMNVITFYITFFLLSFHLSINKTIYSFYFVASILMYTFIVLLAGRPYFTETLAVLLVGSFFTLPFYSSFKQNRINSQAAIIRLSQSNKNLESELLKKIQEERILNEDLQNEITQRTFVEEKLREALKKAETSDQLKSEFLANISHEIRTPLNAIVGFTEMLTEESVSKEKKIVFQELVSTNTMFLLSIIDDIFDASLLKTNQINCIPASFNVNKFIDNINYETSGIELKYSHPSIEKTVVKLKNETREIVTDEYYLRKSFLRLVDNAYKFTSKGKIKFGVKESANKIEFFVEDTGIGISKEKQEVIVDSFVQVDGSFTRNYSGMGLGLTIVNEISKHLGCKLSIQSEPKKGSRFSLIFNATFMA